MCGIAGISGWKRGPEELARALQAMQKAIGHRGPDDRGILVDPRGKWGLVHTRLSILDLSSCGRQPMTSADGKWHIVFNGEIYNHRDFRPGLEKSGHRFLSGSDTEVLLESLAREGMEVLPRLRGMFAFGLLRADDGHVWLGRDLFGIKPLYTVVGSDGELIFASEVRAVLASGRVPREVSPAGLDGYLRTGSLPRPFSLVRGVFQQRSGTWSHYAPQAVKPGSLLDSHFFHKIGFEKETTAPEGRAMVAKVRASLEESLEAHFVSDVPVGLFLSGGIDSTAIAALAASSGRRNLQSYSLGFRERNHDEAPLTRWVARRFGMHHHLLRLDADNGRELFQGYLKAMDQPTLDGFNTYCVSTLAAQNGAKVVLSGLGGDEMFGGYRSFSQVPKLKIWRQRTGILRKIFSPLERFPEARTRRIGEILAHAPSLEQEFLAFRGNFTGREARSLEKNMGREAQEWRIEADLYDDLGRFDRVRFPTDADAVGYLELTRYMRHQLLKDSDVFSMSCGLELRVPFVDGRLFDAIRGLPAARRYQAGKRLLTSAVPEIPAYVHQHPKRGFTLPVETWMKGPWKDLFADVRQCFPGALLQPWSRLWSLKTLLCWLEQHGFERGGATP